jgi:hypothetical protein
VYASRQWSGHSTEVQPNNVESPYLYDPALVRTAQQIYRVYQEVHPDRLERPLGVAINTLNYRGQLIFKRQPILLPQECFIPFEHMESGMY